MGGIRSACWFEEIKMILLIIEYFILSLFSRFLVIYIYNIMIDRNKNCNHLT